MGLVDFLLNRKTKAEQVVEAPAFSLTKVLGSAAVIVAPTATVLVEALGTIELNASHLVALAIGLLGFLAVTSAADVLARSVVTAAEKRAEAELDARSRFIRFKQPLTAREWISGSNGNQDTHQVVEVLAVALRGRPRYLVKNGNGTTWKRTSKITIP